MTRFDKYNKKCKFFSFRMRRGADDKYIKFLENCNNKTKFIRDAIDREILKN